MVAYASGMIGHLKGRLLSKKPNLVLIDVQGVGYEVHIPVTTFYDLPGEGGEVALRVHTHVREDALVLYGFASQREKDFFLKLVAISGIGPKLAVSILSGARVEELAQAVSAGDLAKLTAIPGVGRKTAERILLELKGQVAPFLGAGEAAAMGNNRGHTTDALPGSVGRWRSSSAMPGVSATAPACARAGPGRTVGAVLELDPRPMSC